MKRHTDRLVTNGCASIASVRMSGEPRVRNAQWGTDRASRLDWPMIGF
jgi:hypothetical protein